MQLGPEKPQPFKKHLWLLNYHLKVHQVALEAIVLGDPYKLPCIELVTFFCLNGFLRCEIDSCYNFPIEHDLSLAAYRPLIIPLLKNKSAKDLDTVSVSDIYPARWRDSHSIVSKIDEKVDVLPIVKTVLTLLTSENGLVFVFESVVALSEFLFINSLRYIMTDDHFALSWCLSRPVRNT